MQRIFSCRSESSMKNVFEITIAVLLIGTAASQEFTCPDSNGVFPLPDCVDTCCSSYYVCNQGTAYLVNCSTPGFVYNPSTAACVDPADCTESSFVCAPGSNGFYPDPNCIKTECCNRYEVCVDGVNFPSSCASGTVFDVADLACVDPAVCFSCPTANSNGNFADPECPAGTCCPEYKVCNNGDPSNAVCPPGQIFDPKGSRCDQPGAGDCP